MATLPPDFEDSNGPETTSRLDRRDPRRNLLGERIRSRIDDRRKEIEGIHKLSENNWGFVNSTPAILDPEKEKILESNHRYNSQKFTKKIDEKKLRPHASGNYGSYIQIINKSESSSSIIHNQTLVFIRNSRIIEEHLLKFKNIKSGEAFVWDGKYTPEGEIILRKRNGEFYCYHGEIYLRDPENPIFY